MESSQTIANLIVGNDRQALLPIACRFVPFDQWLVSHVDASWKVNEVKHWLLRKCNAWGTSPPEPPRFRPASPVTFAASRRSSVDALLDDGADTDVDDDWDIFAFDYNRDVRTTDPAFNKGKSKTRMRDNERDLTKDWHGSFDRVASADDAGRSSPSLTADRLTSRFVLFSYSNGHILEDDASLAWYSLRPYELLELHRLGTVIRLPRNSLAYTEPYFDSPIHMLDSATPERAGSRRVMKTKQGRKGEEQKAEWRSRWIVIREGILSLSKDRASTTLYEFPLSMLCALRGPEHLGGAAKSRPRTICLRFETPTVSSPELDEQHYARGVRTQSSEMNDDDGVWVIVDMPDDTSHEHFLRVVHRVAPHPTSSVFIPSLSSPKTPTPSPTATPTTSTAAHGILNFGVQYPEWRVFVTARARKAGLGDLAPAMAHFLSGARHEGSLSPLSPSLTPALKHKYSNMSVFGSHGRASSASGHASSTENGEREDPLDADPEPWFDDDDDSDDDDGDLESEIEWDGWAHDVGRQNLAQSPPLAASTSIPPLSNSSSTPPSPSSFDNWVQLSPDSHGPRARTVSFETDDSQHTVTTTISAANGLRSRSSTVSTTTPTATQSYVSPTTIPRSTTSSLVRHMSKGSALNTIQSKMDVQARSNESTAGASSSKRRSVGLKLQLSPTSSTSPHPLSPLSPRWPLSPNRSNANTLIPREVNLHGNMATVQLGRK